MPIAKDPVEILQVKKLLQCVRKEDYSQISKLCEKGVNYLINYNEPIDGQTALILAAILNNEEMLKFLLENGAHPNIVDFHVIINSNVNNCRDTSRKKALIHELDGSI